MHCRKATRLLSEAMDRPLSLGERAALYYHLGLCRHCRQFSRQVQFMREATRRLRQRLDQDTDESH